MRLRARTCIALAGGISTLASALVTVPQVVAVEGTPFPVVGIESGCISVGECAEIGGTLFFSASEPDHGRELWRSNGTLGGTSIVKNINPAGDGIIDPETLTDVGGTLFFAW